MNKIFLIGNICQDLQLEETASGTPLLKFGLAVKRDYTRGDGEQHTDFFNCISWRGCAENIARYCKKGDKLCVVGKVEFRDYEDNQGIKRRATDVIIDSTEFLGVNKEQKENELDDVRDKEVNYKTRRSRPTLAEVDGMEDVPF